MTLRRLADATLIRRLLWVGTAALLGAVFVRAQTETDIRQLSAGKFLVARRDLPDPNFAEAVVLVVQYDAKGAMGLIVNRRTKIPLSRIVKEAKDRSDRAYLGGPVEITGVLALVRSSTPPAEARHVLGDVYMISTKGLLEKTLAAGTKADAFRLYLGYAGWRAGQLDMEVELGTWHILRGDAGLAFDPDPDSLWSRLIRRTELRIALGPGAAKSHRLGTRAWSSLLLKFMF